MPLEGAFSFRNYATTWQFLTKSPLLHKISPLKSRDPLFAYSLVLNRRRVSCIQHNLVFPWSSCIAIMFLSKKGWPVLYFTLVFNFSCLFYSMMMSLLQLLENAMTTNSPWSLSYEFSTSCITPRFSKKEHHVF